MAHARRRIWGWYFFDWASQPYSTLLLTFIFAPYFSEVARARFMAEGMDATAAGAAAQSWWATGLGLSSIVVAFLAPVLGAVADISGRRLVWVWGFSAFYIAGAAGLWRLTPEGGGLVWALACFGLGFIGMEFATIFTNSLLPSLGPRQRIGEISGSGFAFGYAGGVLALAVMLLFLAEGAATGRTLIGLEPALGLDPASREGTRAVGPFTALWYAVFMLPFFLWVREPPAVHRGVRLGAALHSLGAFVASLRHRVSLAAYLGSSLLYRDALNALYGFGGVYASGVLGWSVVQIGVFGVVGAVTAAVASWLGGKADGRWGPKPVIVASILLLTCVCLLIVGTSRDSLFGQPLPPGSRLPDLLFLICGALIGGAGGALQAASRTMMARHTAPDQATEAFGLYALSGKVTSFIAPALIALVTTLSGSQRVGIAPLILLFLAGLVLLLWVKPDGEERAVS
ncbi:MFS transporter [Rhodobacter sp. CZR27]|uniref:MFS transporter n=1 Tax=Rhodobacter sp. CZR27 TaxID=2033869 RepID=UPI000BBF04FB|nr:MFS transporter [Rhodobacter sp. CZR27]